MFCGCSWAAEDETVQAVLRGQRWDFHGFQPVVWSCMLSEKGIHAIDLQNGGRTELQVAYSNLLMNNILPHKVKLRFCLDDCAF